MAQEYAGETGSIHHTVTNTASLWMMVIMVIMFAPAMALVFVVRGGSKLQTAPRIVFQKMMIQPVTFIALVPVPGCVGRDGMVNLIAKRTVWTTMMISMDIMTAERMEPEYAKAIGTICQTAQLFAPKETIFTATTHVPLVALIFVEKIGTIHQIVPGFVYQRMDQTGTIFAPKMAHMYAT